MKAKLPEGEGRSALIQARVRPAAKARMLRLAKARGLDLSDAVREAFADWVEKQEAG
jgi:antitoxin component of RelBE/YafQ-DinJ toxin-antitoxin module